MTLKPDTAMMPYQNIPIIAETAAVPLGTPQPPTTMTMGRHLSKRMIAIIAGMLMMLMVAGGGTVWMMLPGGASYTTAAEGLVVSTEGGYPACLLPADGTYGGISKTALNGDGHPSKFETCYYQTTSVSTYCWTKSWLYDENGHHFMCVPTDGWVDPNDGGPGSVWRPIDWSTPLSIRTLCGPPCHFQHPTFGYRDSNHHFLN